MGCGSKSCCVDLCVYINTTKSLVNMVKYMVCHLVNNHMLKYNVNGNKNLFPLVLQSDYNVLIIAFNKYEVN